MARKFRKRPVRRSYPVRDLSYVLRQGGRRRRNEFFRDITIFLVPMLLCIVMQAVIYVGVVIYHTARSDWGNVIFAVAVMALVPIMTAVTLTSVRRNNTPITVGVIVTSVFFSFAVSFLSATRVPISFQALALCFPVTVFIMAVGNTRFRNSLQARAAILSFSRAEKIAEELNVPIISDDLSVLDDVETLLIDPYEHHAEKWSRLLATCHMNGTEIMPWTQYMELRQERLDVENFDISHIAYSPSQILYARIKRPLDIMAVILTLPISIPIGLLVAGYIALRDGNPVMFVQIRRGYAGRPFRMYKFRTMYKGTGGGATAAKDDRIIPGCKVLRAFRLDELPQLYNILIGEMSVIGPRPEAIDLARWYEREIPKYTARLLVLPGITGWAQVSHGYTSNPDEAYGKLAYDLYYIKNLSFDLDLLIVFKTVSTVLFGRGAR